MITRFDECFKIFPFFAAVDPSRWNICLKSVYLKMLEKSSAHMHTCMHTHTHTHIDVCKKKKKKTDLFLKHREVCTFQFSSVCHFTHKRSPLSVALLVFQFQGTTYAYDPCGRPFTTLPAKFSSSQADGLVCNVDVLLKLITERVSALWWTFLAGWILTGQTREITGF